jgi:signal transduction histidine kinase
VRERAWFFFVLELCMTAFYLLFGFDDRELNVVVAVTLAFACLLTARLLIELLRAPRGLFVLCALVGVAAAFALSISAFLPLAAVFAADALSARTDSRLARVAVLVAVLLLALIFPQVPGALLATAVGLVLAGAGSIITRLLARARDDAAEGDERITLLETRLENQRATISAIEQQGRRAERNRLAARIHDEVGHGMTGSILMLEAAQLQRTSNPAVAWESVEAATENLRESMEKIRQELRAERASGELVDLKRITAELEGFATEHSTIGTELSSEGMLDEVPQAVWLCIYESLRETLTNLLRHSNANRFRVRITQRNRLLTVEFSDNGQGEAAADTVFVGRGIGLAAIEERALLSGGRAFFLLTPYGFTTRLIFTLR